MMAFLKTFESDNNLITYSWLMTYCQNAVNTCLWRLKVGIGTRNEMGNSNIAIISDVDIVFINYSWLVTHCQNAVNDCQKRLNFGIGTRNEMGNSNMAIISYIDIVFINYSLFIWVCLTPFDIRLPRCQNGMNN